ncbi:hypothetical protein ILYODFUR_023650 [Ilyodon furcidens]|uniref:Uncharacterized protein n=1 Tax=Ilyodon furcidens TaxID=33524 RepID=A0ABV0UKS9_9TELE
MSTHYLCQSGSLSNRVRDSMLLFSVLCSGKLLGTTPCYSSHESPFLSYLQPCNSEITSWKYPTIAHLPVHSPTPHAQLKH